jgi:Zn-dependent peptidase ImmA (M78 family)
MVDVWRRARSWRRLQDDAVPRVAIAGVPKYKLRRGTSSEALAPATATTLAIARIAVAASHHLPHPALSEDPQQVRRAIIERGARWISFKALLQWCWASGIPVIPAPDLPGERKMDAVVVSLEDRPLVLLTKNQSVSAWQLFILAHELGHLALGHVGLNRSLVDEDFGGEQQSPRERDVEEIAADKWAKTLLAGRDDLSLEVEGPLTANGLARAAQDLAQTLQIDAGHLILLFAFRTGEWAVANTALRVLDPAPEALALARAAALESLDLDALSDDNREFVGSLLSS